MVTLKYPISDLARRRAQTLVFIASFSIIVGSQTFLVLVSLALNLTIFTEPTNIGLNSLYGHLIVFMSLLGVIAGMSVLAFLSTVFTWERRRDIAVMKAFGLGGEVGGFFVSQTLILSVAGTCLGSGAGIFAYITLGIALRIPFGSWVLPSVWVTLSLALASLLLGFLSCYIPLARIISKLSTATSLSQCRLWSIEGIVRRLAGKSSFTLKYFIRDLSTRWKETFAVLIILTIAFTSVSVILFGGHTVHYTVQSYMKRGVGDNIFLIATDELADTYVEQLSFGGTSKKPEYLASANRISDNFIAWIQSQVGIGIIDYRIVAETNALEMAFIEALPGPSYRVVGDERSTPVMVVGLHPDRAVENWVHEGNLLTKDDVKAAVIGYTVLGIFSDYSVENLNLFGRRFPIIGVVADSLNMGRTVYLPYQTLKEIVTADAQKPINKIVQGVSPFIKGPLEAMAGIKLYPNAFHPGKVRDRLEYLCQQFGLTDEYKAIKDRPSKKGYVNSLKTIFYYESDPEENAYWETMDNKNRFLQRIGKSSGGTSADTEKSLALYYYKQALRYQDKEAADRYLTDYILHGGTGKGLSQSVRTMNPAYGLGDYKEKFVKNLTPFDKEKAKMAVKYYRDTISFTAEQITDYSKTHK